MNLTVRSLITAVWMLGLVVGCASHDSPSSAPIQSQETPSPTATIPPTLIPFVPSPTVTQTPVIGPIQASVSVVSLNLRSGPSMVHKSLGFYVQDSALSAISRAPGDEWVRVKTSDNQEGWMYASFLKLEGEIANLPTEQITNCMLVNGQVVSSTGQPVDNVTLAISSGDLRTDTTSDENGTFYAFLPESSHGTWVVEVVGVSCKSRIMAANCQYTGLFKDNGRQQITLPLTEQLVFVYQE